MRATMMMLLPMILGATPCDAQQIPIRQLGPVEAVAEKLTIPALSRPLSDGRLIVGQGRRLFLFSADLASSTVVLDSTALTSGPGGMLPFAPAFIAGLADTTFVVDMNGSSLLTIEPSGKVGRVVALPRSRDVSAMAFAFSHMTAFTDPKGRLVYRGSFPAPPTPPPAADGSRVMSVASDTFPIVRADFDTRSADTLGVLRIASFTRTTMTIGANNRISRTSTIQPYPVIDVWTLLPDGTVAVVRGIDYHIDWISPDGARSSSPKMPFDWRRITDDEKTKIIDSVKAVQVVQRTRLDSMYKARGIDPATMSVAVTDVVRPNELPDYYPPVRDAGILADPAGNLWVLPTTSSSARNGLLYDVINRKGEVFERVQLPTGCALNALARDGVVYLLCTTPSGAAATGAPVLASARLERRRVIHSAQ
jgi:hypothetical protein